MKEIGQLLKQARETQGKTLEDVSAQTRIQLKTLQSIEDGEFGRLSNQAFIKGFLRQYAKVLGLDADELLGMFEKSNASSPEPKPASVSKLDSNQLTEKANLLWFRTPSQFITLGAVVIILLLITSIYFISIKIISYSEETVRSEAPSQQTETLPAEVVTSQTPEEVTPSTSTTPSSSTTTPAEPVTAQEQDPHGTEEEEAPPQSIAAAVETKQKMVTVEAREGVTIDVAWSTGKKETVQLNAQGKHVFYYLEKIKLVVSDGGAVKITTHEKSLGIPGESGKPITMNFR